MLSESGTYMGTGAPEVYPHSHLRSVNEEEGDRESISSRKTIIRR